MNRFAIAIAAGLFAGQSLAKDKEPSFYLHFYDVRINAIHPAGEFEYRVEPDMTYPGTSGHDLTRPDSSCTNPWVDSTASEGGTMRLFWATRSWVYRNATPPVTVPRITIAVYPDFHCEFLVLGDAL